MLVAPDLPPNHGTVIVELPEARFVVDASIMHVEPLPMRPGETAALAHPAWGVAGRWQDGNFAINWRPILREDRIDCRIDAWPVTARRFVEQHETTRAWSPFNFELVFNRVDGDERVGVANGCARRLAADADTTEPLRDRVAFLVDVCGVSEAMAVRVPADRPTPPPPGSRSARSTDT